MPKAHNPSAMLVGMIFACIQCIGMIIMAILATVLVVAIAAYNSQEETLFLRTYKVTANEAMVSNILGVVFAVGDIIFTIWVIMVANKARKEIDQGIKI